MCQGTIHVVCVPEVRCACAVRWVHMSTLGTCGVRWVHVGTLGTCGHMVHVGLLGTCGVYWAHVGTLDTCEYTGYMCYALDTCGNMCTLGILYAGYIWVHLVHVGTLGACAIHRMHVDTLGICGYTEYM